MTIRKAEAYDDLKPEIKTLKIDLPKHSEEFKYNCINSEGFCYAIEHYSKALSAGKNETEEWSHNDSLSAMSILDKFRAQLGYVYPQEK